MIKEGTYRNERLKRTATVFEVLELNYGEGRRVYFNWRNDDDAPLGPGASGLEYMPEEYFAANYTKAA
jgi:hypothetical protein